MSPSSYNSNVPPTVANTSEYRACQPRQTESSDLNGDDGGAYEYLYRLEAKGTEPLLPAV